MKSIAFVGDCYLVERVELPETLPEFVVVNWEHAVCEGLAPSAGKVVLTCHQAFYKDSFGGRRILAGLSNNHVADFGLEGLAATERYIRGLGYEHAGASSTGDDATASLVKYGGRTFGLLFYAHETSSPLIRINGVDCVSAFSTDRLVGDIRSAKRAGADFIVCIVHWGAEEVELPPPDVVRDARALVDAGADLVVGHHAHVVQPFEIYKGKNIFYGLGNFYFPDFSTYAVRSGVEVKYDKKQSKKNRRSLLVTVDPKTFEVSCYGVVADLRRRAVRMSPKPKKPRYLYPDWAYECRFKVAYVLGKFGAKIHRIRTERRMPKASAFFNLLKLLKARSFR